MERRSTHGEIYKGYLIRSVILCYSSYATCGKYFENNARTSNNLQNAMTSITMPTYLVMKSHNNCSILFSSWLIEVNASPSLTASSTEDYVLKMGLIEDVLNVIDLENRYFLLLFLDIKTLC